MKKHLLKTMLVGVMALAASSAWADQFALTPSEATVIWASGNSENTDFGDMNFYDATATAWICTQANISGGKLNNQNAAYGGSYAVIVKFDESTALANMNILKATLKFNSVCTVSGKNSNVIVSSIGTDWNASTVTWNNMDRTATQISAGTGQNVATSKKALSEDVTSLLSGDEDKIVAFAIYTYTAREQQISDIVLEVEAVDAASSTSVTLKYVDGEGNELKTADVVGSAGTTFTLTDEQKANFFVGDTKYIYVSDNSADVTIASDGTSVVTLTYREAADWTYILNAVDGESNTLKELKRATAPEGEKVNVGYPAYIALDGALWGTGKNYSNDGKGFQTSVSVSEDGVSKNLTYTNKNVSNVVYLSEGEDIEGMTVCNSSNSTIRSSSSAAAYAPANVTFTTLPAGVYELHAICFDAQKNPNSDWTFLAGETEIAAIHCGTINYYEAPAVEFTLNAQADITIAKGGGNNIGIDLIYIVKTGDVDPAIAALAAAKQALQDAIDQVKGYEIPGLADAIAAAEAAVNAEDATLESLQAAAATFEGTVKTYLKTVLTMGLPMIESMYGEDLATYINDAKAVLAKEDATVEDLAGAMFALSNSAKPYLRGSLENALALANSLGVDTSAVQAVLANEDATGIELITALMTLMTNAVPAINEAIATVKEFFATFNSEASTALAEYFTNFEDAIKTNDLKRIYDTMDALIEAARPYGLVAAEKIAGYFAYMDNEALNADLVAINAAFQNQDLAALIAAVKKAEADFLAAAPGFINKVEFAAAAEYDNGKTNGYENLTKAINDAKAVINDANKPLLSVVLAVRSVVQALIAFEEANSSDLMKEALALAADNEAVAVGKLIAAINEARTSGDESNLQAAIDQFKLDNADQEMDETAKVATNGWKNFNGDPAGVCATQFAPAITTYDGRTANLAEVYEQNDQAVGRTGTIIYQDITGLENGKYKVGFYGNAFFTDGRGMTTTMEDGAEDVAYVFANEQKEFIVAKIATSTTENNFRQFDVEVTDGTIKLGMGKEQAGTNWHTMQIYQLTWFTTAKEVYAQLQDELKAIIAEGEALLADENNTENRTSLEAGIELAKAAVGSNILNITELENWIGNVKPFITAFKKANAIIPEGKYYLVAMPLYEEDNCYMAAGMNWGTQGIVNGQGLDLNFIYNADAENYTIDTNIYNGSDHFLGSNLFMDGPSFAWSIEKDAVNGHCIYAMFDGVKKYIGVAADNRLELTETPYAWKFLEAKELEEEMKKLGLLAMEFATVNSAVDATFLLKDAQFNRNDHRWDAWIVSDNCTNKNLGGGCDGSNGNGCAESFHSPFTISQTLTNVPSGTYGLTAQGFYRQDDDAEEAAPCFFLNDAQTEIPLRTGSENSMTEAGKSFAAGNYIADMIFVYVASDGELTVGVTNGENTHQWVIWDNFVLTYYGSENLVEDITTGINELKANGQQTATDGVYTLSGQKVQKTQKGLYIVNGKKVVLK